jgi:hypothetical protein
MDLKREFFSAGPEPSVSDPLSDRKRLFFSTRPEFIVQALESDLNSEFRLATPEAEPSESVRSFPTPLV